MNSQPNEIYIKILCQSLEKKNEVISNLLEVSKSQNKLTSQTPFDMDRLQELMDEQAKYLEQLDKLDEGFELSYERVKEELASNKEKHKESIQIMQKLIGTIASKTMELQGLEALNKQHMEQKFRMMHEQVKTYHQNNKGVSSYYKNMANMHTGE